MEAWDRVWCVSGSGVGGGSRNELKGPVASLVFRCQTGEGGRVYLVVFFQAEGGIRDLTVTGVQTCALPIFERLEAKIRRRDILVDERRQLAFYAARIPERVNSIAAFNHWRVAAERGNPRLLYMARADLMEREAPEAGPERFPDELQIGANRLPLHYKFEPAQADDGVTLMVPQPLVDMVNAEQLAWLVPGMRLEKLTALLRALPKARRKPLVPVPDNARRALEALARPA